MKQSSLVPSITIDQGFVSIFSEEEFPQHSRGGMILTERIEAQNLRLRESAPGYTTDWHVAGDPTLIIIQQGTLCITLQDGSHRSFNAGDSFIAKDYLPEGLKFNSQIHGHKAAVMGAETLKAVHIKLA